MGASAIAIVYVILQYVFKILCIGAKIATNRVTIILTLSASVAAVLALIYSSLTSPGSYLSDVLTGLQSAFNACDEYFQDSDVASVLAYSLALDTAFSWLLSVFFWTVSLLGGTLAVLFIGVVIQIAPLITESVLAALRKQFSKVLTTSVG